VRSIHAKRDADSFRLNFLTSLSLLILTEENVLIDKEGYCVIVDLGFGKFHRIDDLGLVIV
jgi:hypothetical protein